MNAASVHALFLAKSTDTSGTTHVWGGGLGCFQATGTWDGATVTFEYTGDGTNWNAVGSTTTLTANGGATFELPRGTRVRATVSSAGTSSLNAYCW